MRIVEVEIVQLDRSGRDGILRWNPVYVLIRTDDGLVGTGELGLCYGVGASGGAGMARDLAGAFLLGADPMDNEGLWERMFRRSFWAEGGGPVVFGAMSAIDIALWDIRGKALGQPIFRLLGAGAARPLRCYASQLQFDWGAVAVNRIEPARYAEAALKAVAQGYDAVKVDPAMIDGEGRRDWNLRGILDAGRCRLYRARMEAIRDAVGPDVDVILETHSFPNVTAAVQLAELLADLGIMFFEEPTHYNAPGLHGQVRRRSSMRLAAGERLYTRWGVQPYLEAHSVDVLQPDFGLTGGITEGRKVCDLAHLHDVTVQAHVCGTPVAVAAALHVETAIANFEIHEHHSYSLKRCNRELCDLDLQPVDGFLLPPDAPGLGIELRREAIADGQRLLLRRS